MDTATAWLAPLAREALEQYGLEGADCQFLRHNENAVFRVDAKGAAYVLRLHMPREGVAVAPSPLARAWLLGELQFLDALSRQARVKVQRPIRTLEGGMAASLTEPAAQASLLTWLEGAPLREDDARLEPLAEAVGGMVAALHDFVLDAPQTRDIARPRYDGERLRTATAALEAGVAMGLYDAAFYRELALGGEAIGACFDVENARPGAHGLIHADLGLGNLIVAGPSVSPIDFSLSGHGPFAFDLGGLMGAFSHASPRGAVLRGYAMRRPLDGAMRRPVEAGFLAGIYLFMAMHLRNARVREWFFRRLPVVMEAHVRPFLRGEPFLEGLLAPKED